MVKVALLAAVALFAIQDGADIYQVKYRYEKLLNRVDGVQTVTVGGVDGKLKLVVTVRDQATKAALELVTKRGLDGYEVQILVSGKPSVKRPTVSTDREPEPKKDCSCDGKPGKTVAAPKKPEKPTDPYEECDWVRRRLGMKPRKGSAKDRCHERLVTTNDPGKISYAKKQGFPVHRSAEMSGWTCYTYLKHRKDCPVGRYREKVIKAADGLTKKPLKDK